MINLEDIMTRDPLVLGPQDTIIDARNLMYENDIRHVPIVNERGDLVGIFSQRDLFYAMEAPDAGLSVKERELLESNKKLEDVMTTTPATVSPEAPLRDVAIFLQSKKYGCLPVMKSGELIGIITDSDFVGVAINLLEQIELSEPLADEIESYED